MQEKGVGSMRQLDNVAPYTPQGPFAAPKQFAARARQFELMSLGKALTNKPPQGQLKMSGR